MVRFISILGWTHRFDRQLNTKSISFPKQYFMYLLKSIDQFTLVCKVYAMVKLKNISIEFKLNLNIFLGG